MHACTDRHHCLSNTVSLRTEEPISAAGQSNWQLCYGPSGWIHLDSTDEAKKKPVPNCTPISSSAQQEAIANQMLINWKQALDLEKPFSVLRKTMCWACQLFYQLLEKQNLHFPVLLLQTTSGFALLKQYSADQVPASITLLLRARRAQSLCRTLQTQKYFTLLLVGPSYCCFLEESLPCSPWVHQHSRSPFTTFTDCREDAQLSVNQVFWSLS